MNPNHPDYYYTKLIFKANSEAQALEIARRYFGEEEFRLELTDEGSWLATGTVEMSMSEREKFPIRNLAIEKAILEAWARTI